MITIHSYLRGGSMTDCKHYFTIMHDNADLLPEVQVAGQSRRRDGPGESQTPDAPVSPVGVVSWHLDWDAGVLVNLSLRENNRGKYSFQFRAWEKLLVIFTGRTTVTTAAETTITKIMRYVTDQNRTKEKHHHRYQQHHRQH